VFVNAELEADRAFSIVRMLVEHGQSLCVPSTHPILDEALFEACHNTCDKFCNVIEYLIEKGARISIIDGKGTALHRVMNTSVVKEDILFRYFERHDTSEKRDILHCVDPLYKKTLLGMIASRLATGHDICKKRMKQLIIKLLNHGADLYYQERGGRSALKEIAEFAPEMLADLVAEYDHLINKIVDDEGNTVPHALAESPKRTLAAFVIAHKEGCDLSAQNVYGDTPLHVSARFVSRKRYKDGLILGENDPHPTLENQGNLVDNIVADDAQIVTFLASHMRTLCIHNAKKETPPELCRHR